MRRGGTSDGKALLAGMSSSDIEIDVTALQEGGIGRERYIPRGNNLGVVVQILVRILFPLTHHLHGCQMAKAGFLDSMCLALRA